MQTSSANIELNSPLRFSLWCLRLFAVVAFSVALLLAAIPLVLRHGMVYPQRQAVVERATTKFVHRVFRPIITITVETGAWAEVRDSNEQLLGIAHTKALSPEPILYMPVYPYIFTFPDNYSPIRLVVLSLGCAAVGGWILRFRRRVYQEMK